MADFLKTSLNILLEMPPKTAVTLVGLFGLLIWIMIVDALKWTRSHFNYRQKEEEEQSSDGNTEIPPGDEPTQ